MDSLSHFISGLMESALETHTPLVGQFELLARCNISCKMCYIARKANDIDAKEKELSAEKWIDIATQARDSGMLFVNLTGGEPVIKEDFWVLYDKLYQLGLLITLNTNGTTMTQEVLSRLAEKPPYKVLVSLYGASESTYLKICGNAKAFQKARVGVENLLSAGIQTTLRTTLIKDNAEDFPEMADWAFDHGLDLGIVDYVSPRRDALCSENKNVRLKPEDYSNVYSKIAEYYKNKNNEFKMKTEDFAQEIVANESAYKKKKLRTFKKGSFYCNSGTSSFFVTSTGLLTPCPLIDQPNESLIDHKFSDAWKKLDIATENLPDCQDCLYCPDKDYCMTCPARRYIETGSSHKVPHYLCDITRLYQKPLMAN